MSEKLNPSACIAGHLLIFDDDNIKIIDIEDKQEIGGINYIDFAYFMAFVRKNAKFINERIDYEKSEALKVELLR